MSGSSDLRAAFWIESKYFGLRGKDESNAVREMRYALENGIDGKESDRSERQKDPCCETVSHLRCVHGTDHDGRNAGIGFGGMAAGRW